MKRFVAVLLASLMFLSTSAFASESLGHNVVKKDNRVLLSRADKAKLFGSAHVKIKTLSTQKQSQTEAASWRGAVVGGAAYTGYQVGVWAAGGGWGWSFNDFSTSVGWGGLFW